MASTELNLVIGLVDKASGGLGKIAGGLSTLGKIGGAALLGGAVVGVTALSAALVGGIADAREANLIMAQTENVIKSTGGAAGVTAGHIADLSGALSAASGKSLFGDSQIQESANLLLTFTNLKGGVLDAATAMSTDLAQAMGGAPADAALQLGKALNDPIAGVGALSRVGVTFTEEQKKVIKSLQEGGDMAGAQAVILAELNKEFGGSAEAAAKADGGMAQFKDRMGELAESIGAKVLPAMNTLMGFLNSDGVQAGITALVDGLVNGVGVAFTWLSGTAIPAMIGAWNRLQPALAVVLGVADGLRDSWLNIVAAFQDEGIASALEEVIATVQVFGGRILTWITEQAPIWAAQLLTWGLAFTQWIIDALPGVMETLGTLLQSLLTWVADNAPAWAAELLKFGLAAVEWVTAAIGPLVDKLGEFANTMINWVVDQLPGWGKKLAEFGALAIKWVLDALPGLMVNLGTLAGALIGWILQTAIDVVPKLLVMALKFVSWVVTDVLPELPGALLKIWNALVLFVQTAAVDIVPKLKLMATRFLTWIETDVTPFLSEKMETIKTTILGWIDGAKAWAATALTSIGTAIVQSLLDGINSMIGAAQSALDEVIRIINSIPGIPNIPTAPSTGGSSGFRASGGPVAGGRSYVVGERGPEIFVPRTSGTIVANGQSGQTFNFGPITIGNSMSESAVKKALEEAVNATLGRNADLRRRTA